MATFKDGLSAFLTTWSGVHTAYSFNQTNANTGTDTTHDANSSTYGTATGFPNYGLAATCSPDQNGDLDIYIVTDAAMMLYIPAGLTHGQVYGLFHNGGGTNAQSAFLRATTTGVEIACVHNAGASNINSVIHEIPDAQLPGWFAVGFQYASAGGSQGDMALWIDGVKERSGTRSYQLLYGSGNPQIGDAGGREPTAASCLDPSSYSGGNWGAEATINSSGILIANFVADNPNDDNTSPAGCGDSFHEDYYDEHLDATVEGEAALVGEGLLGATGAAKHEGAAALVGEGDLAGTSDQYVPAVSVDSPDVWWRFTETSGTTVDDYVGTNDLTVSGANLDTTGATNTGSAVSFDGTDDEAESDSGLGWDGDHSLTVEAWLKACSWTTASATPDSVFLLWVDEDR